MVYNEQHSDWSFLNSVTFVLLWNMTMCHGATVLCGTPLTEKLQFFMTHIQGVRKIPLKFWSRLTWLQHKLAADLSALMDSDLVDGEIIEVHWTHCHLHGTSLRWLFLVTRHIFMLEVSIIGWVKCGCKGVHTVKQFDWHKGARFRFPRPGDVSPIFNSPVSVSLSQL